MKAPPPDKILMVHYGPYLRPFGGGSKADRFILEHLAAQGFDCTAVVPASHSCFVEKPAQLAASFASQDVTHELVGGVDVHVVYERSQGEHIRHRRLLQHVCELIDVASPKWIFVTGSDRGHWILKTIVKKANDRNVVYLPRSTAELPIGPRAILRDDSATRAMAKAHSVLCASQYMANYIKEWSGLIASPLDIPVYGAPPFPDLGGCGRFITLVNPCTIKGIDIFLELSRLHPYWQFAAVPTWGSTDQNLRQLRSHPNVVVLAASSDIDVILRETRILLVPSLWDEAFGMIVIEAMLRGIPVLASETGGLPEAKLGVPYLLPVRGLTSYHGVDEVTRTPLANIPRQDIGPWSQTLSRLMENPAHYAEISRASRYAAITYVAQLNMRQIDELVAGKPAAKQGSPPIVSPWEHLSATRRAALAERLRVRKAN